MTLTARILKGLNLLAFPYQRTKLFQKKKKKKKKITSSAFFHSKVLGTKFELAIKKVKVNPESSFI